MRWTVAALLVMGHLLANAGMTAVLLKVSYHNYPGGNALHYLNTHVSPVTGGLFSKKKMLHYLEIYCCSI